MDKEYNSKNIIKIFFYRPCILGFMAIIFFSIVMLVIAISTKNPFALIFGFMMGILMFFMVIILETIIVSMTGITKKIIFNQNIIIKKDVKIIFDKYKYKAVEFKANGMWKGIYIKEGNKYCRIWKHEYKKNEWNEIIENIKKYSLEYKCDYDISAGYKYVNIFKEP